MPDGSWKWVKYDSRNNIFTATFYDTILSSVVKKVSDYINWLDMHQSEFVFVDLKLHKAPTKWSAIIYLRMS